MIPSSAGRDGEIEAFVVDRYLESLLARASVDTSGVPAELEATALRLAGSLPRFHPSFRFEDELSRKLAAAAAGIVRADVVSLPAPVDVWPDPALDRPGLPRPVVIGGVLEPANALPVIVEDEAFVGAGCALLDGVRVGRRAVIAAGVTLTGTSRLYDLVRGQLLTGTQEAPLVVPPGAVVVPGTRRLEGAFAAEHGLAVGAAIIVKDRDEGTSARVALENALR